MQIAFADCEMDLRRQELRRAGQVVHTEPQVFDLLLLLVRNRDRVVSKDELFGTIWNGRIVSEAALSSRINAARKAIGDDGDRQLLIRTIHKRGFRFVGEVREAAIAAALPAEEHGAAPRQLAQQPAAAIAGPPAAEAPVRKPSLAVMPFEDLGPDPGNQYLSYGLTEDIIRLLARNRWLDVLSRHTCAAYRGRDVSAREIGAALGIRYLLQGSIMKRGEQIRIGADLICAETGRQLWSETYDLAYADILQIQDAMARQIAAVIEPELARLEREAAMRKPPGNLDAWDCYQRGLWYLWGFTTPSMAEAEAMFRRSIELDPGYARAHGALSYVHLQQTFVSEPEDRPALLDAAMRHARAAVLLDDRDSMNLCVLGRAHCMLREYEDSVAALEQAIALNPSFAQGYFGLGFTLTLCGRETEALALVERATELSPRDPHLTSFHHLRALAYFSLGNLDAAATYSRMATRLQNANYRTFALHAAALGLLGKPAEAHPDVQELLRRKPGYHCAYGRNDLFFCANEQLVARYVEGLRLAGVPEGLPAPIAAASLQETRSARRDGRLQASARSGIV
jgi:TolB-like protein/Tfp pilus assembly protein PilF